MKNWTVNFMLEEMIDEVPRYGKFLKDVITGKRSLADESEREDVEGVKFIKEGLPEKKGDPGMFTIPCYFEKVLPQIASCDLGDSIKMMPLRRLTLLDIGVLETTQMKLQMADGTVSTPVGIMKYVVVRVQ